MTFTIEPMINLGSWRDVVTPPPPFILLLLPIPSLPITHTLSRRHTRTRLRILCFTHTAVRDKQAHIHSLTHEYALFSAMYAEHTPPPLPPSDTD
jgi:hypothetical protein